MTKILIIDYKKGGNIFSLANSLLNKSIDFQISSSKEEIAKASKIIFPGVGSFATAMNQLKVLGLTEVIKDKIKQDIPFLGICVGMQVLFERGEEGGNISGLEIIPGSVTKFKEDNTHKIPQIGWNKTHNTNNKNPLFKGIKNDSYFYYVHSYKVSINEKEKITKKFPYASFTETEYGEKYISSFWDGKNFFATQFHPEKSGEDGLRLLRNFAELGENYKF